jgi:hypothetical protein
MYTFTPMSEEEIQSSGLLEDGIYEFEVIRSTRKTSKSNNPMAELQLKIWDKEGKIHTIFDYLVFSTIPLNIRKVKHFCDAVGLQEQYKLGQMPEELSGYSGKAHIIIQKGNEIPSEKLNGKPVGSLYPDKNVVDDYMMIDEVSIKNESHSKGHADLSIDDDSVPF